MIIPAGFAQVNLFFDGAAAPTGAQTTFGVNVPLLMAGDANLAAAAVRDAFLDATVVDVLADELHFVGVEAKYGPNDTGPTGFATGGSTHGEAGAGGAAGVAMLMHKRTAIGGRKGRGRMFWPGVPESQIMPGGSIDASVTIAWEGRLVDFFEKVAIAGCDHYLLHGDATAPTAVTSIVLDGRVATQRRRQRR